MNLLPLRSYLLAKKRENGFIEIGRLFELGHMSALVNNQQFGSGNAFVESVSVRDREKAVLLPPDDQCWFLNLAQPVVEEIFPALDRFDQRVDGAPVARCHTRRHELIDKSFVSLEGGVREYQLHIRPDLFAC